jgi:ring-1,2-phenylacetyl-CoA epoxidase subunit PaaC
MNHARTDWAFSIARRFLYENADAVRLESLASSGYEPLADLAVKMRREETYHLLHFDLWLRRLAEGGDESRTRLGEAIERLWDDAQAVFAPLAGEACLVAARILPEPLETLRARWLERIASRLEAAHLPIPAASAHPDAEGRTRRTDEFAWLHGEFTMVSGSEADATW